MVFLLLGNRLDGCVVDGRSVGKLMGVCDVCVVSWWWWWWWCVRAFVRMWVSMCVACDVCDVFSVVCVCVGGAGGWLVGWVCEFPKPPC